MNVVGRRCIGLFRRDCGVPAIILLLIRTLLNMPSFVKALFDNPSENFNFANRDRASDSRRRRRSSSSCC